MFFKKTKRIFLSFLLMMCIFPINILAYSDYLLVSGKSVGIQIKSDGIMVVGLYSVNNISPGINAGINLGDRITKINGNVVNNVSEMISAISNSPNKEEIKITFLRGKKENTTTLNCIKSSDGSYKTGLYVKDEINGVGTLTYVDPETMYYGALGHAIIDKNTMTKVEIKDGKIYKSNITGITKSTNGSPGEKNAFFDSSIVYGNVLENTESGIYGKYTSSTSDMKLYKVADIDEIKLGSAKILTVLSGDKIEEYDINITKLNDSKSKIKNISFDITDDTLLEKTGGIVQGMSGSPIVQGDKIIGAVTHVVVEDTKRGYGIYVTNMLEEMEN